MRLTIQVERAHGEDVYGIMVWECTFSNENVQGVTAYMSCVNMRDAVAKGHSVLPPKSPLSYSIFMREYNKCL